MSPASSARSRKSSPADPVRASAAPLYPNAYIDMFNPMKRKVLVVAAHPDDEVLGVAGTLLKHVRSRDSVSILILGEGETSKKKPDVQRRALQAKRAAKRLGASRLVLAGLPDQRFDTLPFLDIVKRVEAVVLGEIQPDILYTHSACDLNLDHRIAFQAVLTACRPGCGTLKRLLSFETLSSTEWQRKSPADAFYPSAYSDISDFIDEKIEIMRIYRNDMREYPHPRSEEGIRALARCRGMEAGVRYAEAFQPIRLLDL